MASLPDEERSRLEAQLRAAIKDRRRVEPIWYECLAFCKGFHWVKFVGQHNRTLVTVPNPRNIDRYTVDELTQFRLTLLGELSAGDDRPQVLFRQDDAPSEDYAEQANDVLEYGWQEEWDGDQVLLEAKLTAIDLGTAPVRCRYDNTVGPVVAQAPYLNGQPVLDKQAQAQLVDQAVQGGQRLDVRDVKQGRICWEAGTPFNVLVPPGFPREDRFPWECWVSVEPLAELKERYKAAAADLAPDAIRSVATLGVPADPGGNTGDGGRQGTVKDHCLVYTVYQRPTTKLPEGRVVVMAGEQMKVLDVLPQLPYMSADKTRRAGVHYLHCVRVTDRFWSRGFVELGLSPQRAINKRVTQIAQTIDRDQAKVFIEEGALKRTPDGYPMEVVWLKPGKPQPQVYKGAGPGDWMYKDVEANRENLARAIFPDVGLGENPDNVQTYSQLALLKSQAARRLDSITQQHRATTVHLCEDSLYDIGRYWPDGRKVQVAGEDGQLRAFTFNASQMPDYYRVMFASGSGKPRGQEAQLQLITDTWQAAVAAGAVVQDPAGWVDWFKRSNEAGRMLDLPTPPVDTQREKALHENAMFVQGIPPEQAVSLVDYFDNHELHITVHRQVQAHARLMGRDDQFITVESHVKEHERQAILNAAQQLQNSPAGAMSPPQLPPGPNLQPPPGAPPGAPAGAPAGPAANGSSGKPAPPAYRQ